MDSFVPALLAAAAVVTALHRRCCLVRVNLPACLPACLPDRLAGWRLACAVVFGQADLLAIPLNKLPPPCQPSTNDQTAKQEGVEPEENRPGGHGQWFESFRMFKLRLFMRYSDRHH